MSKQARSATGSKELTAVADRGYFKGEEILACQEADISVIVPKPLTSASTAEGRFGNQDFIYEADVDEYRCQPAFFATMGSAEFRENVTDYIGNLSVRFRPDERSTRPERGVNVRRYEKIETARYCLLVEIAARRAHGVAASTAQYVVRCGCGGEDQAAVKGVGASL